MTYLIGGAITVLQDVARFTVCRQIYTIGAWFGVIDLLSMSTTVMLGGY